MKSVTRLLLGIGLLAILGSASTSVCGQSGTAQGTRGRTDPVQRELQRRFESEAIERALAASPRRRAERDWRITLGQIRADFLRIQIVNDDLQKFLSAESPLDLKSITKNASEITKCAERLRDNLVLPEIEKSATLPGSETETETERLRSSLAVLSNLINAFVANPVFEKFRVVDAKLSAQARRDLEQIIEVSKQAKRSSEKLRQARSPAA